MYLEIFKGLFCRDIPIKRSICKKCRTLLLAGMSCKVRIKKKKVVWICLKCQTPKVFTTENREYSTWTQKEDSLLEILDYNTPLQDDLHLQENVDKDM